jgi:MOSC domain-containing protein YiiM
LTGTVVQINTSLGGVPKRPVPGGRVTPLGIEGDAHAHPQIHGGPAKALLLMALESINDLKARGYPVFPGALGENITMQGIDPAQLRAGHQFRLGTAAIELTRIRIPCSTLDVYGPSIKDEIYDASVKAGDAASPRWAKSGFYARVLEPGFVRPGDSIELLAALA